MKLMPSFHFIHLKNYTYAMHLRTCVSIEKDHIKRRLSDTHMLINMLNSSTVCCPTN